MIEFQENINALNQCHFCKTRAGRKFLMGTMKSVGTFLLSDARGFKVCNLCADKGLLIKERKLNKKERKVWKKQRRELASFHDIPHVTLDKDGKVVE